MPGDLSAPLLGLDNSAFKVKSAWYPWSQRAIQHYSTALALSTLSPFRRLEPLLQLAPRRAWATGSEDNVS